MQALAIHWRAHSPRYTPLGVLLAAAALLCASWVALDYADADAEDQALQARQTRLNRMQRSAQAGRSPKVAAGAPPNAAVEAQLQRPWNALLQTLEQTQVKDVALLSLDAQGASHTLRLVGEARSMEPALAYVKALGASPALKKVVLTGQEGKVQSGVAVTRFALDANWGGKAEEGAAP